MPASPSKPFFVVFDTSTQAPYYADVHRILALPPGAILRYEYKRSLFSPKAWEAMQKLWDEGIGARIDVLVMYGEKKSFVKGQKDPDTMLTWEDSVFVPTRSARLVNIAKVPGDRPESDNFHFHMEMRGYVDPDAREIETLVRALEAENSLPFGTKDQYSWVSVLPDSVRPGASALVSDDTKVWKKLIDRIVTLPTQFADDVFWRLKRVQIKDSRQQVTPTSRPSNVRREPNAWNSDFPVFDGVSYAMVIESHSAPGRGGDLPPNPSVAVDVSGDESDLVKLPTKPVEIVPNQEDVSTFTVRDVKHVGDRYLDLVLTTQSSAAAGAYPIGSTCQISIAVSKERWRTVAGFALVLLAAVSGVVGGIYKDKVEVAAPAAVITVVLGALAYFVFTRKIQLPGLK
ncbi:MAG: hypothetical protein Q8R02_08930 [Hyphomonadaceae bacterium]|nr:hypothetical protein [Hyphomonadaceae bacterium]